MNAKLGKPRHRAIKITQATVWVTRYFGFAWHIRSKQEVSRPNRLIEKLFFSHENVEYPQRVMCHGAWGPSKYKDVVSICFLFQRQDRATTVLYPTWESHIWKYGLYIGTGPVSDWLRFVAARIAACTHDDVIKWKHFPRYWPFVRGIHRSPVNSSHKGQWRGALILSLICVWINDWVNNSEAGDLRRYCAHYNVTVMP